MSKLFTVLLIMLEIPINYFDGPTNLFSDLSLAKFLDTSTKSFFQWINMTRDIPPFS